MSGFGRLGDILVQKGMLNAEQLQKGLSKQKESGGKIGRTLLELGFVNSLQVTQALAEQFSLPCWTWQDKVSSGSWRCFPRAWRAATPSCPWSTRSMPRWPSRSPDLAMIDDLGSA